MCIEYTHFLCATSPSIKSSLLISNRRSLESDKEEQ